MSGGVWDVLGIAPTRDAAAIRKAYATRLKAIKRDLDPHEFQRLREAYEAALAQADGTQAPLSPVPPGASRPPPEPAMTAYGASQARPRIQVVQNAPAPRAQRGRWKDIAVPLPAGAPAPPGRRKRDAAPAVVQESDERNRVEKALKALADAVASGSPALAIERFIAIHGELSHPVNGVSIAGLAGFERALLQLIAKRSPVGEAAAAVAREASRRFHWAERMRDVRGDLDPLTDSLAGLMAAEEIMRCARGEAMHRCPVPVDFARDLTGPISDAAFARRILEPKRLAARRAQWRLLEQDPAGALAWLPAANVEWWRHALTEPRFVLLPAFAWIASAVVVLVPFVAWIFGLKIGDALGFCGLGLVFAILPLARLALNQDTPAFAFLRPAWRLGVRVRALLAREWAFPGARARIDYHVIAPALVAWVFGSIALPLITPGDASPDVELVMSGFAGWLGALYTIVAGWFAYRAVAAGFARLRRAVEARISRFKLGVMVALMAMVTVPAFVGIEAMKTGQDALEAMKGPAIAIAVLAAVAAAGFGVHVVIERLRPAFKPMAWGAAAILGVPLVAFFATLESEGVRGAAEASGYAALALAGFVVPVVALIQVAPFFRRIPDLVDWIDRRLLARWFPRVYASGVSLIHVLEGGSIGLLFALIGMSQPTVENTDAVWVGSAVALIAVGYFVWQAPRRL